MEYFFSAKTIDKTINYLWGKYAQRTSRKDILGITFQEFLHYRNELLSQSAKEIKDGRYIPTPAVLRSVYADKIRPILGFTWVDRFWIDHLALALQEKSSQYLSDSVFSFRKGRSPAQALERLQDYIRTHKNKPLYVIRRDIQQYGPSMQHEYVLQIGKKYFGENSALIELLRRFCRIEVNDRGVFYSNARGLPAGSFLQTVFDNIYLTELDASVDKMTDALYLRFGDDILFITINPILAQDMRELIDSTLERLQLKKNTEKSIDICLGNKPGVHLREQFNLQQVFNYLGMQVDLHGRIRLPREKLRRLRSFLRQRVYNIANNVPIGEDSDTRLRIACAMVSSCLLEEGFAEPSTMLHYLKLTNDETQLGELDIWVALTVIKLIFKKGFKRSNFRHIRLKKLRSYGLSSFLHLKRVGVLR